MTPRLRPHHGTTPGKQSATVMPEPTSLRYTTADVPPSILMATPVR